MSKEEELKELKKKLKKSYSVYYEAQQEYFKLQCKVSDLEQELKGGNNK